jgi:trehalose 6-phosphate synthase
MRSLRRQVLAHDVDRWARSFLDALAQDRVAGSALLTDADVDPGGAER